MWHAAVEWRWSDVRRSMHESSCGCRYAVHFIHPRLHDLNQLSSSEAYHPRPRRPLELRTSSARHSPSLRPLLCHQLQGSAQYCSHPPSVTIPSYRRDASNSAASIGFVAATHSSRGRFPHSALTGSSPLIRFILSTVFLFIVHSSTHFLSHLSQFTMQLFVTDCYCICAPSQLLVLRNSVIHHSFRLCSSSHIGPSPSSTSFVSCPQPASG